MFSKFQDSSKMMGYSPRLVPLNRFFLKSRNSTRRKYQVSVSIAAAFPMLQVHSGVQESFKAQHTVPSF
jgi:hypothetical protein